MAIKNKVLLIVLDGFGLRKERKGNAILLANPENFFHYWKNYPHSTLDASGESVGMMRGFIGTSEVGHCNIGAGRVVRQDIKRISDHIEDGSFYNNRGFLNAIRHAKNNNSSLHLFGLVSDSGVHSHIGHLYALLKLAKLHKVKNVYVHAFTDGRDTHPKSAKKYIRKIESWLKRFDSNWKIATVIGRYYAMDRDKRWWRTKKAYDSLTRDIGFHCSSPIKAVDEAYKRNETDEFIQPTIVDEKGRVKDNDSVIFFNFRQDRARQLTQAFADPRFENFKVNNLKNLLFVAMTNYDPKLGKHIQIAFDEEKIKNTLPEILSKAGVKQLRIAETEKWAHLTFFFNGLSYRVWNSEKRILIPSPKVKTYDKTPGMSAPKIAKAAIKNMKSEKFDFIAMNFANPDMVGHTGNLDATIKAIKVVDRLVKEIIDVALKHNYIVCLTADHGNAEEMSGDHQTSHTLNPVPFILISKEKYRLRKRGVLGDIAPTVLELMGIRKPKEMISSLLI